MAAFPRTAQGWFMMLAVLAVGLFLLAFISRQFPAIGQFTGLGNKA